MFSTIPRYILQHKKMYRPECFQKARVPAQCSFPLRASAFTTNNYSRTTPRQNVLPQMFCRACTGHTYLYCARWSQILLRAAAAAAHAQNVAQKRSVRAPRKHFQLSASTPCRSRQSKYCRRQEKCQQQNEKLSKTIATDVGSYYFVRAIPPPESAYHNTVYCSTTWATSFALLVSSSCFISDQSLPS